MSQRPHLRREMLSIAGFNIWVWGCRTLHEVGYGQHWLTAYAAWRRASPAIGEPVVFDWALERAIEEGRMAIFPAPYTDATLQ